MTRVHTTVVAGCIHRHSVSAYDPVDMGEIAFRIAKTADVLAYSNYVVAFFKQLKRRVFSSVFLIYRDIHQTFQRSETSP